MIRYVFREDEPLRIKGAKKADAQVIGNALAQLANKAGGEIDELKPKQVVDAARKQSHPLHPHFEWDDSVAAESYRLDQARSLIRIVRVVDVKAKEGTTRAFLSVASKDGRAYHSVGAVKRSADLQTALLKQADRDLEAFERRYRELVDVCKIVKQAREQVRAKLDKLESRAAA